MNSYDLLLERSTPKPFNIDNHATILTKMLIVLEGLVLVETSKFFLLYQTVHNRRIKLTKEFQHILKL